MEPTGVDSEKPQNEIYHLSEKFPVFVTRQNKLVPNSFILQANDIPEFNVNFKTFDFQNDSAIRRDILTPFTPDQGYPIDSSDLEIVKRAEKYRQLGEKRIDTTIARIQLEADGEAVDEKSFYSITKPETGYSSGEYVFKPDIYDYLSKLQLVLRFPTGVFVSQIPKDVLDYGAIQFNKFYPVESGVLATGTDSERNFYVPYMGLDEGLDLLLPDDPEKLIQIQGRFLHNA